MTSAQHLGSDAIWCKGGVDILDLAREFDIHPGELETVLNSVAGLVRASRPAPKASPSRGGSHALGGDDLIEQITNSDALANANVMRQARILANTRD